MTFAADLVALYPQLTKFAKALKRGHDGVEDLVQDTLLRCWAKRHLFEAGTKLDAWACFVMHGIYVNGVRKAVGRDRICASSPPLTSWTPPAQEHRVLLCEILAHLATTRYAAITTADALGHTRAEIMQDYGLLQGTVSSNVSRGRAAMRAYAAEA